MIWLEALAETGLLIGLAVSAGGLAGAITAIWVEWQA